MTDKDIEEYVVAVDVNSICYCGAYGKVKCKAHQRLFRLGKDIQAKVNAECAEIAKRVADAACHKRQTNETEPHGIDYVQGQEDAADEIERAIREKVGLVETSRAVAKP